MKRIFSLVFLVIVSISQVTAQKNYADSLKEELRLIKEEKTKVDLLSSLGWHCMWSYADTALNYLRTGLQLSREIGYKSGEANCMLQLCLVLTQTGSFTNALDFGFKAIRIFEELLDTVGIASSNLVIGVCYRDLGQYEQAIFHAYKGKNIIGLTKYNLDQAFLHNISAVYEKNNQLDSALHYGEKSYKLFKTESSLFQTLGNIHFKLFLIT